MEFPGIGIIDGETDQVILSFEHRSLGFIVLLQFKEFPLTKNPLSTS